MGEADRTAITAARTSGAMQLSQSIWPHPAAWLRAARPRTPVMFFAPSVLQATARRFLAGFPGQVTYAVKANPHPIVMGNLDAAGIGAYDVASTWEIDLTARTAPGAAMHFNNPVRSRGEIAHALNSGVRSFSVDAASELDKLLSLAPKTIEVSVRFKLPVRGAAYDFGEKFGAAPAEAAALLRRAAEAGASPSLTFHPGTQCIDPAAWEAYIVAAGRIASMAGVTIARLNVGGGFPSGRMRAQTHDLEVIFSRIGNAAAAAFPGGAPALVCEPGRAMVAEAFSLAVEVRAVRDGTDVFLSDGIYGGLSELPVLGGTDRIEVLAPDGPRRTGPIVERRGFGPTCDSLDRLPGTLSLPADTAEGDWIVFHGLGAYSSATATRFNGFGDIAVASVLRLTV
jgi:ornithine decarboxylase